MIFHSDEQTVTFFVELAERRAIAASARMRNQHISARERVEARHQCEKWRAKQDKLQKKLDQIHDEADAKVMRWTTC